MSSLEGQGGGAKAVRPGSGAMFDGIAGRYDMLNRVLSLGMDQSWRRRTIRALELSAGDRVLDLATGTADLALMATRLVPGLIVEGLDPSSNMLEVGREKVSEAGLSEAIRLVEGDAQALPYPDDAFRGTMIAFGIRNVPDRPKALREMARVTEPGGRVAILELTEPRGGLIAPFSRAWCRHAVPLIGALLSGSREYRYLQSSVAAFPPADEFSEVMGANGLSVIETVPMGMGACTLFVAQPLEEGAS